MSSPETIVPGYNFFTTTDEVELAYQSHGDRKKKPLILVGWSRRSDVLYELTLVQLHGFTGSSAVWDRNISALREKFWVIVPDLRGHGRSGRRSDSQDATVARLGKDLKELVDWLGLSPGLSSDRGSASQNAVQPSCIAGSLGCAITWLRFCPSRCTCEQN